MRCGNAIPFLILTSWLVAAGAAPAEHTPREASVSRWSWYVFGGSSGDLDVLAEAAIPSITADSLNLAAKVRAELLGLFDANANGGLDEIPIDVVSTKAGASTQVGLGAAYCFNQRFTLDFGVQYGSAKLTQIYKSQLEIPLPFDFVGIPVNGSLESDAEIFSGYLQGRFYPWTMGSFRPWLSAGLRRLSMRTGDGRFWATFGAEDPVFGDSSVALADVDKVDPYAGLGFDLELSDHFDLTVSSQRGVDLEWSAGIGIVWKVGGGRCGLCPTELPQAAPPLKPETDWQEKFESLVRDGVVIETLARSFSFEGPVKGLAPLVVDFQLEKKGWLQLDIWTEDASSPVTLEFRGAKGGRRFDKATLPRELGDWQTAQFTVRAFDGSGEEIDFGFFGIGVGERAVGSMGIYQVTFRPRAIRAAETAAWGFRSRNDFEQAKILFYHQDGGNAWKERWALDSSCLPRRGKRCKGEWDGSNDRDQNRSSGRHRIGIRAWQSSLENDWIIVVSRQVVEVL